MAPATASEAIRLHCIGVSHRTAAPELRERTGFSASRLADALSAARHHPRIERLVIVATCHRTELYAETPSDVSSPCETLLEWWASRCTMPVSAIAAHAYELSGMAAVGHLFRVASGLDSVVLGEAQIVAQVAGSLRRSVAAHAASPVLKIAFRTAVRVGERARTLAWGRLQAASLGSAAIDAAAAAHGLRGRSVLVVGAGEIAELALRSLEAHEPRRVTIANRTLEAAQEMASRHSARACSLDQLAAAMHDADVVIAATRASHTLIDRPLVAAALEHRPDRPMTLVDVSLPRNIDIGVRDVTGAQLIGIDDLGSYVAAAHAERRAVVPTVERIVDEELALVHARLTERTSVERPPAATPRSSAVAA